MIVTSILISEKDKLVYVWVWCSMFEMTYSNVISKESITQYQHTIYRLIMESGNMGFSFGIHPDIIVELRESVKVPFNAGGHVIEALVQKHTFKEITHSIANIKKMIDIILSSGITVEDTKVSHGCTIM